MKEMRTWRGGHLLREMPFTRGVEGQAEKPPLARCSPGGVPTLALTASLHEVGVSADLAPEHKEMGGAAEGASGAV